MQYYMYDNNGHYTGSSQLPLDPIATLKAKKDVYAGLPENATSQTPLPAKEGFEVIFKNNTWAYEEIVIPEEPKEPTRRELLEGMSPDELKAYLYSTLKYKPLGDDLYAEDSTIPLISLNGLVLTVDALTDYYNKHLGDEGHEMDYEQYKVIKSNAKEYIRSITE